MFSSAFGYTTISSHDDIQVSYKEQQMVQRIENTHSVRARGDVSRFYWGYYLERAFVRETKEFDWAESVGDEEMTGEKTTTTG